VHCCGNIIINNSDDVTPCSAYGYMHSFGVAIEAGEPIAGLKHPFCFYSV